MPQTSTTAIKFSDAPGGVLSWPAEDWHAALQPPTVLVADDDDLVREMLTGQLQGAGYRTIVTDNGQAAMALAVTEHPQLVILGMSRPGLDGLGLCYQLHSSPQTAHIPVILISDRGTKSEMDLGRMVGAEDYLVKPVDPGALLRSVGRLVPAGEAG